MQLNLSLRLTLQRSAISYDACSILLSLICFVSWSNSYSDVNMQLVHNLEFFELFFNSLVASVIKNRLSCWDFT